MKKKYSEFEEEEQATSISVPNWQVELGTSKLQAIASGTAGLMDWEETKKQLKR